MFTFSALRALTARPRRLPLSRQSSRVRPAFRASLHFARNASSVWGGACGPSRSAFALVWRRATLWVVEGWRGSSCCKAPSSGGCQHLGAAVCLAAKRIWQNRTKFAAQVLVSLPLHSLICFFCFFFYWNRFKEKHNTSKIFNHALLV